MTPSGDLTKRAEPTPPKRRGRASKPDISDVWAEVARRTEGRVVADGRRPKVHVSHGPWTVILDKHVVNNGQSSVTYTRTRAYLLADDDFSFRMSKRNLLSRFGWIFGMTDVSVGDRELEARYVFRTKHASRLRSVLHDRELRELMLAQPSMRLELKGLSWWQRRKRGSRVRVLTVRTTGLVTEVDRLVSFVRLVQSGLDQLQRVGAAKAEGVSEDGHNGDLRRRL